MQFDQSRYKLHETSETTVFRELFISDRIKIAGKTTFPLTGLKLRIPRKKDPPVIESCYLRGVATK
jgi:hypothetical protein